MSCALIIGASGGIGEATLKHCLGVAEFDQVHAVSRSECPSYANDHQDKLTWHKHHSQNPEDTRSLVKKWQQQKIDFSCVFICTGYLHGEGLSPEKRLEDLNIELFRRTVEINSWLPMYWLQSLLPLVTKSPRCVLVILSARVGSIEDNRLGGWYSYRASKSALNMLLKTASIEFSRRAKGVKLISFHPGTTDTGLSKPFQQNVPEGKLFEAEFVAKRVVDIALSAKPDGKLDFIDWDSKPIEW